MIPWAPWAIEEKPRQRHARVRLMIPALGHTSPMHGLSDTPSVWQGHLPLPLRLGKRADAVVALDERISESSH